MFNKKQFAGRLGEDLAAEYLKKKGVKIVQRNFRIRGGEIDIVGIKDGTLIFFEVKTRSTSEFGSPLEAITPWKLRSLVKTAQFYKLKHPTLPDSMRIDAVAIEVDDCGRALSIEQIENISG